MSEQQQAKQNPRTFGRYAEIPTEQLSPEQKEAYDYRLKARGMCPGPYRIWLQNPKLLKAMTPIGVWYQREMQISKQKERSLQTASTANGRRRDIRMRNTNRSEKRPACRLTKCKL